MMMHASCTPLVKTRRNHSLGDNIIEQLLSSWSSNGRLLPFPFHCGAGQSLLPHRLRPQSGPISHPLKYQIITVYWNLCDFLMNLTMSLTVARSISLGCKLGFSHIAVWQTALARPNTSNQICSEKYDPHDNRQFHLVWMNVTDWSSKFTSSSSTAVRFKSLPACLVWSRHAFNEFWIRTFHEIPYCNVTRCSSVVGHLLISLSQINC